MAVCDGAAAAWGAAAGAGRAAGAGAASAAAGAALAGPVPVTTAVERSSVRGASVILVALMETLGSDVPKTARYN
jgi:hypothetical protein